MFHFIEGNLHVIEELSGRSEYWHLFVSYQNHAQSRDDHLDLSLDDFETQIVNVLVSSRSHQL